VHSGAEPNCSVDGELPDAGILSSMNLSHPPLLSYALTAAFLTQTVQLDDSTVKFEIWCVDRATPCKNTAREIVLTINLKRSLLLLSF
jgi:hypothetical protein